MFSKVTEDPTVSLQDVKDHLIPDRRTLGIGEIAIAKKYAKKSVQLKLTANSTPNFARICIHICT